MKNLVNKAHVFIICNYNTAKKTIFKDKIIHGVLGVSLFSNLIGNQFSGGIYMSQYVNFVAPIYCEEEVCFLLI